MILFGIAEKKSVDNQRIRPLLNGPELDLPEEHVFVAHGGKECREIRYRWWESLCGLSYRDALFPGHDPNLPNRAIENPPKSYPVNPSDPILFFGHYAISGEAPAPILPNLACLDYGCGKGGHLVAYSWDGEAVLDSAKFIAIPQEPVGGGIV